MTASQAFTQRLYEAAAADDVAGSSEYSEPTPDDVVDAEIIDDDAEVNDDADVETEA